MRTALPASLAASNICSVRNKGNNATSLAALERQQSLTLARIEAEAEVAKAKARGQVEAALESQLLDLRKQEAEWAINHGAEELDLVPNFFALEDGKINDFAEEIAQLIEDLLADNLERSTNMLFILFPYFCNFLVYFLISFACFTISI